MAILINVETEFGMSINNSYARVQSVGGGKTGAVIELFCYANQIAVETGAKPVKQTYIEFVPSVEDGSPNFIKQGYEHLKTLPEFIDSIDA